MSDYQTFLASKRLIVPSSGIDVAEGELPANLFDFQRALVRWALRKGRAALFAGTGLGKTAMQLAWAAQVCRSTGREVLILAPLAVSAQTVHEGAKFGIAVAYARDESEITAPITITNYERLDRFDPARFAGVVIDESGILKAYDGATRTRIIEAFATTPFRLACTATPAPNDTMELGNHAEFLGIMSRTEMLSMFFVHDGGETQKWRLKGHAEHDFWRWVCSWAAMLTNPSDLGYDGSRFVLPPLTYHRHVVESNAAPTGMLFAVQGRTLKEQRAARRASMADRVQVCADLVNANNEPWLIFCDLNAESEALCRVIPDAVNVQGSDDPETKERNLLGFADGDFRVLVTKGSMAAHGLNYQHCARVAFVGVSHSFETYYQAVRRCWRFGQVRPVECHVITSRAEGAVVANLERKEREFAAMQQGMLSQMSELNRAELRATERETDGYQPQTEMRLPVWLGMEVAA